MYEYLTEIINLEKFANNADALTKHLNAYAAQGWRLKALLTNWQFIFEREVNKKP